MLLPLSEEGTIKLNGIQPLLLRGTFFNYVNNWTLSLAVKQNTYL